MDQGFKPYLVIRMSFKTAIEAFFRELPKPEPHASLVVDVEAGEWQCGCPPFLGFNTSINPKYVAACGHCGRQRPSRIQTCPHQIPKPFPCRECQLGL